MTCKESQMEFVPMLWLQKKKKKKSFEPGDEMSVFKVYSSACFFFLFILEIQVICSDSADSK